MEHLLIYVTYDSNVTYVTLYVKGKLPPEVCDQTGHTSLGMTKKAVPDQVYFMNLVNTTRFKNERREGFEKKTNTYGV
jgi:hypothetical protein